MDSGNIAWLLLASCLAFLVVPGIAFFYGGLVRVKSILNMIMLSVGSIVVTGLVWVLWGWSVAFGGGNGAGIAGNPFAGFLLHDAIGSKDGQFVAFDSKGSLYSCIGIAFECVLAMIAIAVVSGAVAERVKFSTWLVFVAVWVTVVYAPLAHMEWNPNGLLSSDGALSQAIGAHTSDIAGGALIGVGSAVSAMMIVLIIGRRRGFQVVPMKPHNLPLTMLGAFLIWFGCFGLTTGSAVQDGGSAGYAWLNTVVCASAATLAWLSVERLRAGHFTALGAASGMVTGLVAILPGVTVMSPLWALVTGVLAGIAACLSVSAKYRLGYDDSLDVVAVNGVGGIVGLLATGLFANGSGLFVGGGIRLLFAELVLIFFVILYAGVLTGLIAFGLEKTLGWRVGETEELAGIDIVDQGERAYDFEDSMNSVIKEAK